jgi:hypothetical protein
MAWTIDPNFQIAFARVGTKATAVPEPRHRTHCSHKSTQIAFFFSEMIHMVSKVGEDTRKYLDKGLSGLMQISGSLLTILYAPEQSHSYHYQRLGVLAKEQESLGSFSWMFLHFLLVSVPQFLHSLIGFSEHVAFPMVRSRSASSRLNSQPL